MKPHSHKEFDSIAVDKVAKIYEDDFQRIYAHLCEVDAEFKVPPILFAAEYLALRLALGVQAWTRSIQEMGIKDESTLKIFLKAVLASFQSPQFVNLASAFGEYVAGEEAEEQITVAMAGRFLMRTHIFKEKEDVVSHSKLFQSLIEILESYRMECENEFFVALQKGNGI
jgi:hypothetical protein